MRIKTAKTLVVLSLLAAMSLAAFLPSPVHAQTSTSTDGLLQWNSSGTYYNGIFGRSNTAVYIPGLSELSTSAGDWVQNTGFNLVMSAATDAAQGILYIIGYIASALFWLGAQLIGLLLSLNSAVLSLPAVTIGWAITRDIANLGFVLAIIVIAFATIVRYKDYGAKALLPRLIAAAIIVNFSLTICAVFLNFSDTLTYFFVSRSSMGGNVSGLATAIASAFNPQSLLNTNSVSGSSISGSVFQTGLATILGVFMAAVFTLLAALALLAIGIMLLVRFINIAVLLVLAPIAWLFWVIPDISGEFKKWWSNFLKWTFYPPILAFFIYLTLVSIDKLRAFTTSYAGSAAITGSSVSNPIMQMTPFETIANMVVLIGFLFAGLSVADSMGMAGAKTALNLASKAGKGAKAWAGKRVSQTGKNLGRRALTAGVDENGKTGLERWGTKLASGRLGRIPLVGRALTGISGASSKARQSMVKDIDEQKKRYDMMTPENLATIARQGIMQGRLPTPQESVALFKALAEKGGLDKLDPATFERLVGETKKLGAGDQITPFAPQLAGRFATIKGNQTMAEAIAAAEAKAASKITEIPKNANDELARFLERNAKSISTAMIDQFGMMSGDTGKKIRAALKNGINREAGDIELSIGADAGKQPVLPPQRGYDGIKNIRNKLKDHTNQIETYDADIEDLTPKVEDLESDLKEKAARVEKSDTEIKELRTRLTTVQGAERAGIEREISTKTAERQGLEAIRQTAERVKTERKNELTQMKTERKELKHEKQYMQKALDSISELPRDKARAVDNLDKIEKNAAYKSE